MEKQNKKIGLALSGGAVLGIAHIGVIKALEENNIPIDIIAGTSAGSAVGAFFAAGYSSDRMFEIVKQLSWAKISRLTLPRLGLLDSSMLERFIDSELDGIDIPMLPKKFAAIAVDLTSGKEKIFKFGKLSQAVRASCAIPGVFTPLVQDEKIFVDGGVLNFIPTNIVRDMGADVVIAVKLLPPVSNKKPPDNIIQVLVASSQLALNQIAIHAPNGDVTIIPELQGLNPHDFHQADILFERGYEAARKSVSKIESVMNVINNAKKE